MSIYSSSKTLKVRKGKLCTLTFASDLASDYNVRHLEMELNRKALSYRNEAGQIDGITPENTTTIVTVPAAPLAEIDATTTTPSLIANPGGSMRVAVGMNNTAEALAVQFVVILPEGFSVKDDDFSLTDRAENGAVVNTFPLRDGRNGYRIVIANYAGGAALRGFSGDFLTFEAVAPEDFSAASAQISIDEMVVSVHNGAVDTGVTADPCTIAITNGGVAFDKAMTEIKGLEDALAAAIQTIETECPDVRNDFMGEDVKADIEALKNAVVDAYNNHTLTPDYSNVMVPVSGINEAITKLIEDAKAAQQQFLADKAAEEARQQAYTNANAEIKALQDALAAAQQTIATEAPDVKDNFKGEAVAASIEALKNAVEQANTDKVPAADYESIMAGVPAINEAIAKLIEDAKAAEQQFLADKAAEEARQQAYTNALAEVKTLEDALAAAQQTIATEAPDVKDNFKGEAVAASIEALKNAVEQANTDKVPAADYEPIMAGVPAINESIAKLIEDAKAAEEKFLADKAAEEARQQAYANANAEIKALQDALTAAQQTIATEAPDVKDNFKGTEITVDINALKAVVEKAYNDKTIVADYETIMAGVPAINEAIAKLIADAKAAQQQFEADAALAEALKNANAKVRDIKRLFSDALQTIADECPDVKDSYTGVAINAQISALEADIRNAFDDKSLVGNYDEVMAPAASIEAAIAKLIEDAKAAQQKFLDDKAAEEARQQAYANANAEIKALQDALAAAQQTIATDAPDVKDNFKGTEITADINTLKDDVEKAYTDKTIAADYETIMAGVPAINEAIAKLIEDATAAQKAYEEEEARMEANKEAYEKDLNTIRDLQTKLDQTVDMIRNDYPDFDVDTAKQAAQTAIDDQRKQADDALKAVEEEGEYSNTVNTEAVEKLISDLWNEAKLNGIDEIFGDEEVEVEAIYTVNGVRVENPIRGQINIFVTKNGRTRRVLVK